MPTFNRRDRLPGVLAPLLDDDAALEVIVVVDGCADGSYEYLQERARTAAKLVPVWIENSGEGAARAAGAARSHGEVVLLLDDDVRAAPGLVAGHARRHAESRDAVVIGYMPLDAEAVHGGGFATRLYALEYEGRCRQYESAPGQILDHLWAGNVSVAREHCLAVGLASDEYRERYHPDRELGLRFAAAGLHGVFDRTLLAAHLHARDLPSFRRDARSQGAGRVRLAELHPAAVGAFSLDELSAGTPGPVAAVIRLARRPRAGGPLAELLAGVVAGLGRLRWSGAQLAAGRLLRRVEQTRGAAAALARRRTDPA